MRIFSIFLALLVSLSAVTTLFAQESPQVKPQEAPLVSDPAEDQFDFCKQLYRQANSLKELYARQIAYQQLAPRLQKYVRTFPKHPNAEAASYYLGECLYHSGSLNEARNVLSGVVRKYKKGRYVALSSNRLGYDEVAKKNFAKAAVHFGRVADSASTAVERYRGLYQQASCYLYAGDKNGAIRSFSVLATAEGAGSNYREGARLKLGNLYYEKKNYDKAKENFELLMLPGPSDAVRMEATLHVGLISLEQGDSATADSCFKSVLLSKENKFKPNAQAALVNSYYNAKKYEDVLDVIRTGDFPGTEKMEASKYSMAGRSAYKLKRYEEAIKYFANAERQIPLSEVAFESAYYRLLSFYKIEGSNIPGQVDAFLEIYKGKYPQHERIHKALLAKAETLFDQEKFRDASTAYNRIDVKMIGEENQANLFYKSGCSLAESGDHNRSVKSFTNFLAKYPDDPRIPAVIARRGSSYLALGDRVSALNDFELLIKQYPKDKLASLALQNAAKIKKENKDYAGMIVCYEKLITEFPTLRSSTSANAHYWIGWGKYQILDYQGAINSLKSSIKLDKRSYGFNGGMLIVYSAYSLKDKALLESAVKEIRGLGKAEKVPAPIYRWLGAQNFKKGEFASSERYLTLGTLESEPRQTPGTYWKMLGTARVKTGKNLEALVAIKNFLDVEEEPFWRAEAYYDQAVANLGLSRLPEAKASAEEALGLRPKGRLNAEIRMILGDVAFKNKEYAAAASFYVVVVQLFVDDEELRPVALHKAHLALTKKGDAKEAAHYLEQLNKEFPDFKVGE